MDNIKELKREKSIENLNTRYNSKRDTIFAYKNFIEINSDILSTSFDDISYYNKIKDGSPLMFYKKEHPLWEDENSLVNRLKRFIDERYILIDTKSNSQQILLVLSIFITILLIIDYFIETYKKRNNIIIDSGFMKFIKQISGLSKMISFTVLVYYSVNNIILRTTSLTYNKCDL